MAQLSSLQESLLHKQVYHYRMDWLPTWARSEESARHAIDCGSFRNTNPIDRVVGPAIPFAFFAATILFVFYACFPWIVLFFTDCAEDDGFAKPPIWILLAYEPFLVVSLLLEFICMQRALPGFVVATGPFRLLGISLKFSSWFLVVFTLSVIGHLDFMSIGLMAAKLMKTGACSNEGKSRVEAVWQRVLDQSALPAIVHFRISTLGLVCYALVYLQFIYACKFSIKLCSVGDEAFHYGLQDPSKKPVWYHTALGRKQGHGHSMEALAEMTRMATISTPAAQYVQVAKADWPPRLLQNSLQREVAKFLIFNVLSGAVQPNLQSTVYALSIATDGTTDWVTQLSISSSLLMAFKGIVQSCVEVKDLYQMIRTAKLSEKEERKHAGDNRWVKSVSAPFALFRFSVYATSSVLMTLYACAKLFAAAFICSKAVWNLSGCALES